MNSAYLRRRGKKNGPKNDEKALDDTSIIAHTALGMRHWSPFQAPPPANNINESSPWNGIDTLAY
jgi:hypothetical protein